MFEEDEARRAEYDSIRGAPRRPLESFAYSQARNRNDAARGDGSGAALLFGAIVLFPVVLFVGLFWLTWRHPKIGAPILAVIAAAFAFILIPEYYRDWTTASKVPAAERMPPRYVVETPRATWELLRQKKALQASAEELVLSGGVETVRFRSALNRRLVYTATFIRTGVSTPVVSFDKKYCVSPSRLEAAYLVGDADGDLISATTAKPRLTNYLPQVCW